LTAANRAIARVEAESEKAMSSICVRFPDETRELLYPSRELEEGDTIWHDGTRYRILSIAKNDGQPHSVIVEPEVDKLGDLLLSEEGALRLVPVTEEGL
jgi:hypothetical protein